MFKANDALERAKAKLAASTQFIELHKAAAQKAVAAFNSAVAKIKEQEAELKDKEDLITYLESREAVFVATIEELTSFLNQAFKIIDEGASMGGVKDSSPEVVA